MVYFHQRISDDGVILCVNDPFRSQKQSFKQVWFRTVFTKDRALIRRKMWYLHSNLKKWILSMESIRRAVFPGSFDPITTGHIDLVKRALPLFDEIIIAIGINSQKQTLFDLEKRRNWILQVFEDEPRIKVDSFEGLTVHYCKKSRSPLYYTWASECFRFWLWKDDQST